MTRNSSRSDKQARRLEADDGRAALDMRQQRSDHAARLAPGLVDEARGEKRAAAAQRPPRFRVIGVGAGDLHAIAGGVQHLERRVRVFRLEVLR